MSSIEDKSSLTVDWTGPDGELGVYIAVESNNTLEAYGRQPNLVNEHANHEEDTARGGYAHRQMFELVQNSADALTILSDNGRIAIRLTKDYLYCADNGNPIDQAGVKALMFSHMSPKRGTSEIGRFGLGFKSVLGVTDAPEFFSRSGSFRFDRCRSRDRIRQIVPDSERYPVLRLPEPIDPHESRTKDDVLRELMKWAMNIVRLPLKPGTHDDLARQMSDFPPEFLLFVEHVHQLTINDDLSKFDRILKLKKVDDEYYLADGNMISHWKLFKHLHTLSGDARADRRSLDDSDEVPIWWAAPLDRLNDPGVFWAFFPTNTASLVAGILNAPWKTNEDRQNLLSGPYNDELIKAAAKLIADALPELATEIDPARHLDALPRRREAGDSEQSVRIRNELVCFLSKSKIVPDQNGTLRAIRDVEYPPNELTSDGQSKERSLDLWAQYPGRPLNWLHHRALPRNRLARIDQLFDSHSPPRASIAKWLEALVEEKDEDATIEASKAAIQTAALIPPEIRQGKHLGKIVLTAGNEWQMPDPDNLFLPEESSSQVEDQKTNRFVHYKLASDSDTRAALEELGLGQESPEDQFRSFVEILPVISSLMSENESIWRLFWERARNTGERSALDIIRAAKDFRQSLRIRTQSDEWQPFCLVLLPGEIVPGDGSRDSDATLDIEFHKPDIKLLRKLGATSAPCAGYDLSSEPWYSSFLSECRDKFKEQDLPRNPYLSSLNFASTCGSGPLQMLTVLSDEGRELYTEVLLHLDTTYGQWIMKHDTQNIYPKKSFDSPVIKMLCKHGRVRTSDGIVPFRDALGRPPKNQAALHALLTHSNADQIKEIFNLAEPIPEFIGEEYPVPLIDIWPGLELPKYQQTCQLIRCERILIGDTDSKCVFHGSNIYLTHIGDYRRELQLISDELELELDNHQIEEIHLWEIRKEIEERRAAIRELPSDAERLLKAIGEQELRQQLPNSLLAVIESDGISVSGIQIAEAAIATYHSGALKQYRHALNHLDPPARWAGSARAIDFVRSLGFSEEWAGERNRRRDPFLEVEGPYRLPKLHDYQKTIVTNVRNILGIDSVERRGMISMPTGSGKTRVAVQAIVEAMCHDGHAGGILWIADRDELCEQAVEAWRQVWSNIGTPEARLRISRMWAGQPDPLPLNELHVIVATIQTLYTKLEKQSGDYEFLSDFKLVVFDEAHRSIAPTSTSVMQEIGLTRWQREDEPFLIGLTATPYRGHDEVETRRLVRRYGNNRLDAGAFASDNPETVIQELQNMSVLAQADHEIIEGGTFSLDPNELKQMENAPWLPRGVEDRIARDFERTKRILGAYETHVSSIDPDWPTLIFATSVEHAQTVAALLNTKGFKSRAVSGMTEPSVRRRIVEEFRNGEIKVLVNYGVFREGFDAPKTRAIIVARPVYSPNLYFQMIGRGLRGVKNGGNDRCLILNVQDNIENFERKLAFSNLDWLWG